MIHNFSVRINNTMELFMRISQNGLLNLQFNNIKQTALIIRSLTFIVDKLPKYIIQNALNMSQFKVWYWLPVESREHLSSYLKFIKWKNPQTHYISL